MFNFDLDQVQEQSYGAIPAGKYLAQVEKVELKDSKSGGQYLNVMFNIIDEEQNGRKFFEIYNIANANPETVKIALGQIKSLVIASGANIQKFTSPDQLIGLECVVGLKVVSDEYGEKNKITNYSSTAKTFGAGSEIPKGTDGKPIF